MSKQVPASVRYKELTALAADAAEKLRQHETAKAAELESIYSNLGTRLSSKQEKREVTVAFAGGGLVLLLLGGGLSLAWFGRLP